MTTPLNAFSSCSDENTHTISVINAAMTAAFRATGKEQKECTILDCGTGDGDFVSALARKSNFPCHIFGIDLESDTLKMAEDRYRAAGAISARAVQANIVDQNSTVIRRALGWEDESNGDNAVHRRADILLASHIGYYIPPTEKSQTLTKFSRLIDKNGMMVFIHSDGHSEFNDLREMMNKEINTDDFAMYRTHNELQWSAYRNYFPAFSVEIPCNLHLPNNEAALRAAWFGIGFEDLSEEGRRDAALLENIISFAANNTPVEELREELDDRMEQIWQDFWQPKLEKCRGQQELQLSVAGGKLTFSFQVGKSDLANQVRNAVSDYCRASSLENTSITYVIGQDNTSALGR